jgi:hypothetical protein
MNSDKFRGAFIEKVQTSAVAMSEIAEGAGAGAELADRVRLWKRQTGRRAGKLDQACESSRININRTFTYTPLICITTNGRAIANTYPRGRSAASSEAIY